MARKQDAGWELPGPGDVVAGKYEIGDVLGEGGLATVFTATHVELNQRVAIKMLNPVWSADPEVASRFLREGRAMTQLRSEHAVRVFDAGKSDSGAPYLALDYLEGIDLDLLLQRDGPLPVATAVDYVLQVCEAMAEAHVAGIIHRDLKPANLFLTTAPDGSECVKVLDFGISKVRARPSELRLTNPSLVMGTPDYMPPEQLRSSASADERSDVSVHGGESM